LRWNECPLCTLSGGGCSGGGVSGVVHAFTHDVFPGHAGLMASLARQAGGAVVANFDLVSMCPAVPDFVPHWFGVTPVGGAKTGLRQWGGRSCCMSSWYSGGVHSCNGELDVSNGLGEHCIGGHQVLNGGVLLNCRVFKIFE
jgi:hypothetical protein